MTNSKEKRIIKELSNNQNITYNQSLQMKLDFDKLPIYSYDDYFKNDNDDNDIPLGIKTDKTMISHNFNEDGLLLIDKFESGMGGSVLTHNIIKYTSENTLYEVWANEPKIGIQKYVKNLAVFCDSWNFKDDYSRILIKEIEPTDSTFLKEPLDDYLGNLRLFVNRIIDEYDYRKSLNREQLQSLKDIVIVYQQTNNEINKDLENIILPASQFGLHFVISQTENKKDREELLGRSSLPSYSYEEIIFLSRGVASYKGNNIKIFLQTHR